MKIKVEIEIDVPADQMSEALIKDAVMENLVRYAEISHLRDIVTWTAKKGEPDQTPQYYEGCKRIIAVHKTWVDIIHNSQTNITVGVIDTGG